MTTKEITALRKAGNLEEALRGAEEAYATNDNQYTAGALFWCLNDVCRQSGHAEDVASIYERMKAIAEQYADDEIMAKSLRKLEKILDPMSSRIKGGLDDAKGGRVDDVLMRELRNAFGNGTLNVLLHSDYGWLIYYTLKNTPVGNHTARKQLLFDYIRLELPRPDLLHSLILGEAIKIEKNTPLQFRMRDFMNLWGWENIREEDWEQFTADSGNTVTSTVEKLISVFAKELRTDGVSSPAPFDALVDRALERYPKSQHMPFYKATALISQGKNSEALDYYRKLILQAPTKCYLWHQASALVDEQEQRIALLCKAINVEHNETFLGRCRLDLAKALIERGLPANAKYELDRYREFYVSQGWSLKQEYYDVSGQIAQGTVAVDNVPLYESCWRRAEEFIYSAIPSVFAIKVADKMVDDRRHPGRRLMQWTLRTAEGVLVLRRPARFGVDAKARNGSVFDIKAQDGRIVWIGRTTQNPLDQEWIHKCEGTVKLRADRRGKPYAIIGDAYVGSGLLASLSDGDHVAVIALRSDDGRWSALTLRRIP